MRIRHDTDPVPGGIGIREENIHQGSGLRQGTVTAIIPGNIGLSSLGSVSGATYIVPSGPQFIEMNTNTFVDQTQQVTAWNGSMPVPMTPTLSIGLFSVVQTWTVQFRLTGYDQFGNVIEEVTPNYENVSGYDTTTGTNHFYMVTFSKVFSYVASIEMRCTNMAAAPRWALGFSSIVDAGNASTGILASAATVDWDGGLFLTRINTMGSHVNWGIGTPVRVSPYGYDPSAPTAAGQTLTLGGAQPADAETVTIDGVVYIWKTALTGAVNEVLRGGSIAISCQNLFDAINHTGSPGTQYTAITVRHPTVRAASVTATTVVVAARVAGSTGNALLVNEAMSDASNIWVGGINERSFSGGADSGRSQYPEILGCAGILLRQTTTPTVFNVAAKWNTYGAAGALTGCVLGRNAAAQANVSGNTVVYNMGAWQGTPHKLGFQSSDAFATAPYEINGHSGRVNGIPILIAQLAEDDLEFSFTVRSRLGTQSDAVSGGGYPR